MAIQFQLDSRILKFPNKAKVKDWIENILLKEGYALGRISITITSDLKLLELNREFLSKDAFTDVIAFEYSENKKVSGEIFISEERVIENAKEYKLPYTEEILKVIVHGILHLAGYKDKNPEDKKKMTKKEEYYLGKIIPNL